MTDMSPNGERHYNPRTSRIMPPRVGSEYEKLNKAVIQVNERLAEGRPAKAYDSQLTDLIKQRETLMEESMMAIDNANVNRTLRIRITTKVYSNEH